MSFVEVLKNFKERPEETVVAYCDESCPTKERYFVIGASYFIPKDASRAEVVVENFENHLQFIKTKHALHKELKWETIPSSEGKYFEGYKAFLEPFLNHPHWYFKCMVIDTSKYSLDHKEIMGGNPLTGYYKFFCVFISDGLMRGKSEYFFDIRMDEYPEDLENSTDILSQTCERRFEKKNPGGQLYWKRCQIEQVKSKEHNLLQLTDLLVGAVSFVWNKGTERLSKRASLRREIIEYIEKTKKVKLDRSTHADIHRFNIWEFQVTPRPKDETSGKR